jgi:hypothetical protein
MNRRNFFGTIGVMVAGLWCRRSNFSQDGEMVRVITPLKPCPFCGRVPDVNDPATFLHETGSRWASVVCCIVGPEVRAGFYTPLDEWKDEAIAAWNQRAGQEVS